MNAASRRAVAFALEVVAWWSLLAALVLPPLSYSGYPLTSLEYLSFAAGLVAPALAFALVGRLPGVGLMLGRLLLTAGLGGVLLLYYYTHLAPYGWTAAAAGALAAVGFAAILFRDRRMGLQLVLAACLSQILVAASATAPYVRRDTRKEVARPDLPPVVHLLLDAYPGLDSFPDGPEFAAVRQLLEQRYSDAGFVVFPRAYSADNETRASTSRLFNRGVEKPLDLIREADQRGRTVLSRSDILDEIGSRRALELTQFDYVSFGQEIVDRPSVGRFRLLHAHNYHPGISVSEAPLTARLRVAFSAGSNWMYFWSRLPAVVWLMEQTTYGKAFLEWIHVPRWALTFTARKALLDFGQELACCGRRGTYYFLHTYFPHAPYTLDRECRTRAIASWTANFGFPIVSTEAVYRMLWRDAAEQAICASEAVLAIVHGLRRNPATRDAIVIVHGDHGARITLQDESGKRALGHDIATLQRDERGTFLAIRWPDQQPVRLAQDQLRIDDVFHALVRSNFGDLDHPALPRHQDSPYASSR